MHGFAVGLIRKIARFVVVSAIILFALFVFISVVAWHFQHNLFHFPSVYSLNDLGRLAPLKPGIKAWPNPSNYMGLVAEPANGQKTRGTVVMIHGNAGSVIERIWYADALTQIGYRTILHEHPGYGARKGSLDENSLVMAALETAKKAEAEYGRPLYVVGESLGSGVAAGMLAFKNVDGAALIVPWDRLENVAVVHYPFLPVKKLLKDKYDSVENMSRFKGSLAVVVAEKDEIIPSECGLNLFDSFNGRKRLFFSRGSGHNEWAMNLAPSFWTDLMAFLSGEDGNQKTNE